MSPWISDEWLTAREADFKRQAALMLSAAFVVSGTALWLSLWTGSMAGAPMAISAFMPLALVARCAAKLRAIRTIRERGGMR